MYLSCFNGKVKLLTILFHHRLRSSSSSRSVMAAALLRCCRSLGLLGYKSRVNAWSRTQLIGQKGAFLGRTGASFLPRSSCSEFLLQRRHGYVAVGSTVNIEPFALLGMPPKLPPIFAQISRNFSSGVVEVGGQSKTINFFKKEVLTTAITCKVILKPKEEDKGTISFTGHKVGNHVKQCSEVARKSCIKLLEAKNMARNITAKESEALNDLKSGMLEIHFEQYIQNQRCELAISMAILSCVLKRELPDYFFFARLVEDQTENENLKSVKLAPVHGFAKVINAVKHDDGKKVFVVAERQEVDDSTGVDPKKVDSIKVDSIEVDPIEVDSIGVDPTEADSTEKGGNLVIKRLQTLYDAYELAFGDIKD